MAGKLLKPEWRRNSGHAVVPLLQPMNREFQARFTAILLTLLTVAAAFVVILPEKLQMIQEYRLQ